MWSRQWGFDDLLGIVVSSWLSHPILLPACSTLPMDLAIRPTASRPPNANLRYL